MKSGFVIFFSIVISLYSLVNYYIITRGLSVIPQQNHLRIVWIWSVVVLAASFLVGRLLERVAVSHFTSTLVWIGAFWVAIMVYLLLMLLVVDLVSLIDKWTEFLPAFIHQNPAQTKKVVTIVIASLTVLLVVGGYINTQFIKVKNLNLKIHKTSEGMKKLRVVAFSDVHLGTLMGERHLQRIVKKTNALHPDIILIPGDIIDEDIGPVVNSRMGKLLESLHSKYGVFAVTGNHEYIGGVKNAKEYLTQHGVHMLNDTVVRIDQSFYLIGREDRSKNRMSGKARKSLEILTKEIPENAPIILLDHQPYHLNETQKYGVDLQLSGHTHHGQIWPFNYITKWMYELSRGYMKKGNTHFYVSSGVGGWGPPIRTVSRPEILNINIEFD